YYADADVVASYPNIYTGLSFLPGSQVTCFRSYPALYNNRTNGGAAKINLNTEKITDFSKDDGSDIKFRHMTCVAYDPENNWMWCGTGQNQQDVVKNFGDNRVSDETHHKYESRRGGGIAVLNADTGNFINHFTSENSELLNNRVTSIVYDKYAKYLWIAHYNGIQYYDIANKTWHEIPELRNDFAASCNIYVDPYDTDKVYFSFYSGTGNYSKVSSQIYKADTDIFEYSKNSRRLISYTIDSTVKGVFPLMAKTSAENLWVIKGKYLIKYNLSLRQKTASISLQNLIPEFKNHSENTTLSFEYPRCITALNTSEEEKYVLVGISCDIETNNSGTHTWNRKNYLLRISNQDITNVDALTSNDWNELNTNAKSSFTFRSLMEYPKNSGTLYAAFSSIGNKSIITKSIDGKGSSWTKIPLSASINCLKGMDIANDICYVVRGYENGQENLSDFVAFGACSFGGGLSHDNLLYNPAYSSGLHHSSDFYPLVPTKTATPYASSLYSWNTNPAAYKNGDTQQTPMMFMMLNGYNTAESRFGVFKQYPGTGYNGWEGHMLVFEPKCAPFAPRVDEENTRFIYKNGEIEIMLRSPGLPPHLDGFIPETINSSTVQVVNNRNGAPVTLTEISYNENAKSIVLTGEFNMPDKYSVTLKCGINGIKNIKGASLTNTRADEYKDEITYVFGENNFTFSDLSVTELSCSPEAPAVNQPLNLTFKIANTGNFIADAGVSSDQKTSVYLDGNRIGDLNYDEIAPGASITMHFTIPPDKITGPNHTVRVTADTDNVINEHCETNNSLEKNIVFKVNPADVSIKDIWTWPANPVAGQPLYVFFSVKNLSENSAAASVAEVSIDSSFAGLLQCDNIAGGETHVKMLQINGKYIISGRHKIKVTADAGNSVMESNEKNNVREENINIADGSPDLAAKDMFTLPEKPAAGQTLFVFFRIDNIGSLPAGTTSANIYLDGQAIGKIKCAATPIGASQNQMFAIDGKFITSGRHQIKITADTGNLIAERDEMNNTMAKEFNVPAVKPDLSVQNIW
ncbi:MAG: CARDB domain-containing protein, partial [Victivallaceae bacterium]